MGLLERLTVAGVVTALIFLSFFTVIDEFDANWGTNYGDDPDIALIRGNSSDKLEDYHKVAADSSKQLQEQGDVNTLESIASFINNVYSFGKFIVGIPFLLIVNLSSLLLSVLGVPGIIAAAITTIMIITAMFALARSVTGK